MTIDTLHAGQVAALLTVNVQNAASGARLDAWIDFNADGDWNDAVEQIFGDFVFSGQQVLPFNVPANATERWLRLRGSGSAPRAGCHPTGLADDGEVEDYAVDILEGPRGESSRRQRQRQCYRAA